MIKRILHSLLVIGICSHLTTCGIINKSFAFTGTTTTGVYVADSIPVDSSTRIRDATSFDQFSLSTKWGTLTGHVGEYVSNSYGSSSATDGWISARGYRGERVWQSELLTLSTGTANLRLVGRLGDVGTGCPLYIISTTTATSTAIRVSLYMDWYKVEYNINTIGTDSVRSILQITDSVR